MSLQEAIELWHQALYVIAFYFLVFLVGGVIKDWKSFPSFRRDSLGHIHVGPWMHKLVKWWTIPAIFVLVGLIAIPMGMSTCGEPPNHRDDVEINFCDVRVYDGEQYLRIPSALTAYTEGVLAFQFFVLIALAAGVATGILWCAGKALHWTTVLAMAAGRKTISLYKQRSPLRW